MKILALIRSIIADTLLYFSFRMYPPGEDAERLGKFMRVHFKESQRIMNQPNKDK